MGRPEFCIGCPARDMPESDSPDANLRVGYGNTLFGSYDVYDDEEILVRGSHGDFTRRIPDDLSQAIVNCKRIEDISAETPRILSEEERARRQYACQAIRSILPEITPQTLSETFRGK